MTNWVSKWAALEEAIDEIEARLKAARNCPLDPEPDDIQGLETLRAKLLAELKEVRDTGIAATKDKRAKEKAAELERPELPTRESGETTRRTVDDRLEKWFTYHPPTGDQAARYETLRAKAHEFAMLIVELTPSSLEQDAALESLRLAVMMANAAIACNE